MINPRYEQMNKNQPKQLIMTGGAKDLFMDMVKRHQSPIEIYTFIGLAIGIVYVKQIPIKIRRYADTLLGRIVLFTATVVIGKYTSWANGLLVAVFALLLLSMSPRTSEGFQVQTSVKKVNDKNKWWVETVLGENPYSIEEDEVSTQAAQ
jgi:hypothetical protein